LRLFEKRQPANQPLAKENIFGAGRIRQVGLNKLNFLAQFGTGLHMID
jgi:hypothetical protein